MDFDFLIPISIFVVVGYVIKVLSDNRVRKSLIEKGVIDENVKYLYADKGPLQYLSSLKWGLVLIGIGLAFLFGQFFPSRISEEMTVGGMFLFAGLGFLIYYFVAKEKLGQMNQKEAAQ